MFECLCILPILAIVVVAGILISLGQGNSKGIVPIEQSLQEIKIDSHETWTGWHTFLVRLTIMMIGAAIAGSMLLVLAVQTGVVTL